MLCHCEKDYSLKNILSFLAFAVVMIGSLALVTSCGGPTDQELLARHASNLGTPTGATNIEVIDEAWYTFEFRGECFLATRYWRHAGVTKINCED
jgi:hypothetical protein